MSKRTITNNAGEPIGTEENMDDGAFDYDWYNMHPEPDIDDSLNECYYCGKIWDDDKFLYPEAEDKPWCGECEIK